jgi:hypothetical protein
MPDHPGHHGAQCGEILADLFTTRTHVRMLPPATDKTTDPETAETAETKVTQVI